MSDLLDDALERVAYIAKQDAMQRTILRECIRDYLEAIDARDQRCAEMGLERLAFFTGYEDAAKEATDE